MASVNCSNAHAVCTPHPFAKANARALQSFEKKIRNVPWWVKKQGVQIPCGTYGAYPKTTSQFAVAIATENYWGCPGVVWRGVNLC